MERVLRLCHLAILLALVVVLLLVLPVYAGVCYVNISHYGNEYLDFIFNPAVMLQYYEPLAVYWYDYFQYYWNFEGDFPASYMDQLQTHTINYVAAPAGGVLFGFFLLFLIRAPLLDFRPFKLIESVHGDAHWATEKEIRQANLRAKKGLLLGNTKKGYLVADDFQHVLLFAPTGSGKGVGFVIPNLLFWEHSVIVHDIKLENHQLTSGWREKTGQEI